MHKKLRFGVVLAGLGLALVGCSGSSEPTKETTGLRDAMTNPKPFDINDVPEKDREMVMKMRGGGGAPGGAPKGDAAPKNDKP